MKKYVITVLMILVIALFFLTSCGKKEQENLRTSDNVGSDNKPSTGVMKGVSLSPKSFQGDDFKDFFTKANQAGSIITWAGDWQELTKTENGGPTVVASLASTYEYIPLIQAQFFTQSTGKLLRPLDDATKQSYKDSMVAFAQKYKPAYLGIGIEVNILYEKSPADFDSFAAFYSEVYDAVKAVSPDTKVFTVFQLERMKGMHGGLFGGTNDPAKAEWQLLDRFPKADLIAFTTYPDLIYKSPAEIPADYYTEIRTKTAKPIAFTEIGWHSAASPAGWESSEERQAAFVTRFFELTKELKPEFVVWSFLYDQDTIEPFNTMGLIDKEGKMKTAFNIWRDAR
ncbi:MAG: hypothetical protein V1743_02115 [Nanoarchaeota archaeon]